MATYNDSSDYSSKGVGNAGLALGIIGTSLASGILGGNGILDGEGMVDVDSVEDALAGAFSKVPKVQFAGFTFTSEDAKTLMAKMRA